VAEGRTALTEEKMGMEEPGTISLRHIGCLPTVWKLLDGSFMAHMFEWVEANGMFPQVQKGW